MKPENKLVVVMRHCHDGPNTDGTHQVGLSDTGVVQAETVAYNLTQLMKKHELTDCVVGIYHSTLHDAAIQTAQLIAEHVDAEARLYPDERLHISQVGEVVQDIKEDVGVVISHLGQLKDYSTEIGRFASMQQGQYFLRWRSK